MSDFEATAFDADEIARRRSPSPTAYQAPAQRDEKVERVAADCIRAIEDNAWVKDLIAAIERDLADMADNPGDGLKHMGEWSYAHRLLRRIQKDYKRSMKAAS